MPPRTGIIAWKTFWVGSLRAKPVLEQMLIHRDPQGISGIEDAVVIQ